VGLELLALAALEIGEEHEPAVIARIHQHHAHIR